jgi:transcriptional regulator with XRE-family HTH domain
VSYDLNVDSIENADMDRMSETEERLSFIGRVRSARMARYPTQKPICVILGLDQGTYKQYEKRSPLPHRYIPKFCAACGVSLEWLLTGEGQGPAVEPLPAPRKRTVVKATKRKAA